MVVVCLPCLKVTTAAADGPSSADSTLYGLRGAYERISAVWREGQVAVAVPAVDENDRTAGAAGSVVGAAVGPVGAGGTTGAVGDGVVGGVGTPVAGTDVWAGGTALVS